MIDERFTQLTDKQRACLRLVRDQRSSKEIALLLGITPDAVDQRLKTAVRVLGAASRFDAARLLAQHERETYQQPVYEPSYVAPPPHPATIPASDGDEPRSGLGEDREEYQPPASPVRGSSKLPLPLEGGRRNDLGLWQRLGWVVAIALGSALTFGAFLMGLRALALLTQPGG